MNSIHEIADTVMREEGLNEWVITWWTSPPSECHVEQKQIWISEGYKNVPLHYQYEILLHEISHIASQKHDELFYTRYAELLKKYSKLLP